MTLDDDRARRAAEGSRARDDARAKRRQAIRRQRLLVFGLFALVVAAGTLSVTLATGGPTQREHRNTTTPQATGASGTSNRSAPSSFAVGLSVLRLVDPSRTIELQNGTRAPRTLLTYVRYPALGAPDQTDLHNAQPARADGPFPLVIFGHGFDVTPALYARLLQSWARAGYVVAAPVFPLENADAPGGPDESDLVNQPADMRFVISSMLAANRVGSGHLTGLIDPARIAVTGQSDGGDTALAVAYDRYFRDPRVGAAVILSGAEIPGASGFTFPAGGPPLLAVQGTADTVNPPGSTTAFFDAAQRPKYLLSLIGAEHLPPYSVQQPQLTIVERVTVAFLDAYLKHRSEALARLVPLGSVPGVAAVVAEP